MEEKLDFLVYCIENYKNANGLKGRYRVFDYINASYEALHTTGREYIIENLSIYINARQKVDSGIAQ